MCLKIASAGDIMLGENVHHYRRGVATRYMGRFHDLLDPEVLDIINSADLFFGNFECSLLPDSDWKHAGLERSMYAAPESALGFFEGWKPLVVLNVANNHFGQHGKGAANHTIESLEARGIRCIGKTCRPLEIAVGERQVVAWGVTIVEDRYSDAGYFKSTPEKLIEDIGWIEKQDGDYWVVSIHWGEEYLTQPDLIQEELAARLVGKGVDLILGHHPHVVQPVRMISGSPVVFSHGNFVFDQNFSRITQFGLVVLNDSSGRGNLIGMGLKHFRPETQHPFPDRKALEDYCSKNMSRFSPLWMRILMKVELLTHCLKVPPEVWRFFVRRLWRRIWKR